MTRGKSGSRRWIFGRIVYAAYSSFVDCHRHHAVGVNGIHRHVQLSDTRIVFGNYEARIVVGDEQRRFFRESCDSVLRIAFVSL